MTKVRTMKNLPLGVAAALAWVMLLCTGAPAEKLVYIQAHGDDIVLISAKVYLDTHKEPVGDDVYVLYTADVDMDRIPQLLEEHLGVDAGKVFQVTHPGPIVHKTAIVEELALALDWIKPDQVFVQAWCGGHPEHDMTHVDVVRALELAGVDPVVYEYPHINGYYYDEYKTDPTVENLNLYFNSLLDLEGVEEAPTVEVDEEGPPLEAKEDLIVDWENDLFDGFIETYGMEELRNKFANQEKYRELLGTYVYTQRPYPDPTLYEIIEAYPQVFDDMRNFALCLYETYGADLWTSPPADVGIRRERIPEGNPYDFQVGLFNKAYEQDVFSLSAAWGEGREEAVQVSFDTSLVTLEGRESSPPLYGVTLDTTGLSGDMTLWIKAESQNAGGDPNGTDYVEVPFLIKVSPCGTVPTLPARGPADRASRAFGAFLCPALAALFIRVRRSAIKKGPKE